MTRDGTAVPRINTKLRVAVEHYIYRSLPDGWEINEGSFGTVTIDAGHMSRPIVEKRGFRLLTYATACNWHG